MVDQVITDENGNVIFWCGRCKAADFRKVAWKEYKKKEVAGCNADCHDGIPPKTKVLGILPKIL